MATGPISFVGGVGGVGPQRIGSGKSIPFEVTRYFRHNLGTIDYAQFSSSITLSGDFVIEIDMLVTSSNSKVIMGRLANTSSAIFASAGSLSVRDDTGSTVSVSGISTNLFQSVKMQRIGSDVYITIDGTETLAGSLSGGFDFDVLYRHSGGGSSIWSGVLANLKITEAGTLIHSWAIDESSGVTIFDSVGSNNATIANGIDDDRGLFVEQPTLWKGQDLAVPPWDSVDQELLKA